MLRNVFDDVRFGARLLRKNAALSTATVVTFAIGIGLNAGVFTVIDGLLFRPRVLHDPASFVEVQVARADASGRIDTPLISLEEYHAFADATSLHDLAAWTPVHATVGDQIGVGEYIPLLVTCNFFRTYGPDRPLLGRLLQPGDCSSADAPPVVVIGEDLWRTSLAADPNVIGSSLLLNRRPFTIVGVMPTGYSGQLRGPIWLPFSTARAFYGGRDLTRERSTPWLQSVVGRLTPGATRASAASELAVIARRLDAAAPDRRTTVRVTGGAMIDAPVVRQSISWIVPLVMAAPIVVLLIACANVALLLLSRSIARRRELAIRISLGASPRRLLQMLIIESALLAAVAGPPSILLAYVAPRVLRALIPAMPYYPFGLDSAVLGYLIAVTLFAGVTAGIAPAIESLKGDVSGAIRSHDAPPGPSGWQPRDVLVAAQVAMSLALLVGAGMFLRAEANLLWAPPGYDIDDVMLVIPRVALPPYTPESAGAFYETLTQRIRALPGVRGIAYARGPKNEDVASNATATIASAETGATTTAVESVVSSAYFKTLQIPLLAGSVFGDDGPSGDAVVVSESLASTLWPHGMPIGAMAKLGKTDVSVIGIARDVQSMATSTAERTIYLPTAGVHAGDAVYVGFSGGETETARAIRDAIVSVDPNAVTQPVTLGAMRRSEAARLMPIVEMIVGLSVVGLALGAAGIYGVVSFAVGRRTREMGIRIALGATHRDIVRGVIRSNAGPIAAGLGAGLVLAFAGGRTLASTFARTPVRMDAADPVVYAVVVLLLAGAALAAMIGPAERAAGADPINALRQE